MDMTRPANWVVSDANAAAGTSSCYVGGKAARLFQLQQAGWEIPPFFVITASAFHDTMTDHGIAEEMAHLGEIEDEDKLFQAASHLRSRIIDSPLPDELEAQIRHQVEKLGGQSTYLAVRSSALDEDAAEHSFAGMHDSFMFVPRDNSLSRSIRKVWASVLNKRALSYRLSQTLSLNSIGIAVVVQQMIDAERSGVLFTCNPASGNVHEIVISSLFGCWRGVGQRRFTG